VGRAIRNVSAGFWRISPKSPKIPVTSIPVPLEIFGYKKFNPKIIVIEIPIVKKFLSDILKIPTEKGTTYARLLA